LSSDEFDLGFALIKEESKVFPEVTTEALVR